MKKDIINKEVKNVHIAIEQQEDTAFWKVNIINRNTFPIKNVFITSEGYGERKGEKIQTSKLRHFFENIDAQTTQQVENFSSELSDLTHQYWVTYYIDQDILDKKFIFLKGIVNEQNAVEVKELQNKAVFHS